MCKIPIFIVGYSRSGTKMMNKVLSKLDIADYVPEIHFFEQSYDFSNTKIEQHRILQSGEAISLAENLVDIVARVGSHLDNGRSVSDVRESMITYINQDTGLTKLNIYHQLLSELSSRCPIDPTPRNAFYICEIAELIPDARFIYMIRDPRDCILSQRKKWKLYWYKKKRPGEAIRLWLNYNPLLMAIFWKNSLLSYEKAKNSMVSDRVLQVNYESMIEKPKLVADKLHNFIGVGKESFDTSFIRRDNSRKWVTSLSIPSIYLIQKITGNKLTMYGYEQIDVSIIKRILGYVFALYYCFKIPFAYLANFNRIKNPIEIIKRRMFSVG